MNDGGGVWYQVVGGLGDEYEDVYVLRGPVEPLKEWLGRLYT